MIYTNRLIDLRLACPPDEDEFEDCEYCDGAGDVPDYQDFGDTMVLSRTYVCRVCEGAKVIRKSDKERLYA